MVKEKMPGRFDKYPHIVKIVIKALKTFFLEKNEVKIKVKEGEGEIILMFPDDAVLLNQDEFYELNKVIKQLNFEFINKEEEETFRSFTHNYYLSHILYSYDKIELKINYTKIITPTEISYYIDNITLFVY